MNSIPDIRVKEGLRLRLALEQLDLKYTDLAKKLAALGMDVSANAVYMMTVGRTRITDERKAMIAAALKTTVDAIWNEGVHGRVSISGSADGVVVRGAPEATGIALKAAIRSWRSAMAGWQDETGAFLQDGYVEVPTAFLVGGSERIDEHDVVRISGNSMHPRVKSGERLVIFRDPTLYRNSIVLATCPCKETYIKALRLVGDRWQLRSVSDEGSNFEDLDGWKILGYAVARFGDDDDEQGFNVEWRDGKPLRV